jgi:hypothetical protein
VVEQCFRKAQVVGSNPTVGSSAQRATPAGTAKEEPERRSFAAPA